MESGAIDLLPKGKKTENIILKMRDSGKSPPKQDNGTRRSGCGKARYDVRLPHSTPTSLCTEKHASKHHDEENSHIP
jgi:hypothetical protein